MKHPIAKSVFACLAALLFVCSAWAGTPAPQYNIFDLGLIDPGDAAQGLGISEGGVAVGRTLGVSNQAFSWTQGGGLNPLPNLMDLPFGGANDANDSGIVVGTGATTFFGSGALPLMWDNGVVSQLPLVAGQTVGRANGVNSSGVAVGSNGGGSNEFAVIYSGGAATAITATTANGEFMTTAFSINDAGLVAGVGQDPNNAAVSVGLVYDSNTDTMVSVGALVGQGHNSAIGFDVGNAGHVVGSSSLNGGANGMPFIWSSGSGIQAIPLVADAGTASARGVNSDGWVVGIGSSAFALPFLFDGTNTYLLQDLIDPASGWDISMNTSSGALGISEDGSIVGTGIINGETHAFVMVLVPEPGSLALLGIGGLVLLRRRRGC